ncbi:TIR domain-containing protein [Paenibacillus sp. 1P07SE]|uniref:TIR domain-containing protein n=1 Tax=Paenibacillus sp. 1P07SE TaxID=3132209 RepID=UPI0039A5C545
MWDVFISHASEDKDIFVRQLANQLSEVYKVNVWYDEFSIEHGDSLIASIEKGLQESAFGIVILSKDFFEKTWTDHEYVSLKTKEMLLNKKIILPIWLNINKEDVAKYSLTLADKFSIVVTSEFDIDEIAIKLIKIIRPDIYKNIIRMLSIEKTLKESAKGAFTIEQYSNFPVPKIRNETLSIAMKARLKLIHNCIMDVDKRSYEEYETDFRRSTNIDRELIITELLTAAFVDCIGVRKMTSTEKKMDLYFYTWFRTQC